MPGSLWKPRKSCWKNYPPEGEGTEENTEKESGTEETETVEEAGEETVQGEETEATAGRESGVE